MARKRLEATEQQEYEQRILKWYNLSPAYRNRLERAGFTARTYADRKVLVPNLMAKARGHGTNIRENSMARIRRAQARGLNVWTGDNGYGFENHRSLDEAAKVYGRKGHPDYEAAADVIIARAEAEKEFEETGSENGPAVERYRRLWFFKPIDAFNPWYFYKNYK